MVHPHREVHSDPLDRLGDTLSFTCQRCGKEQPISSYNPPGEPHRQRCPGCGTSHAILGSSVEVLGKPVRPTGTTRYPSIWYASTTRPYEPGTYECMFACGGPLPLEWDGRAFRWQGGVVDCATLLKWRGSL